MGLERALRLAVPCLGLALLAITPTQVPLRLSWSDEFVYAVMGRNIAEGVGAVSNFYVADAILAAGFPLGDVHMPGMALLLAAAFRLMGSSEAAAFAPAAIAYVLSGWLLFEAGTRLFGPWPGCAAALSLYLHPGLLGYASSAMPETPLVLLSALLLLLTIRLSGRPTSGVALALSVVLVCGALVRETFLALAVLVVAQLLPLSTERKRPLLVFLGGVLSLGALVLIPSWRSRAPYPHFLSGILDDAKVIGLVPALRPVLLANLEALTTPWANVAQAAVALTLALSLITPLFWMRGSTPHRRLAAGALAATLVNLAPLLFVYPFAGWAGFRAQLVMLPAPLLLLAGLVVKMDSRMTRRLLGTCWLALLWLFTLFAQGDLTRERIREYRWQAALAELLAERPECPPPRGVVAEQAFLYGWKSFPTIVIWHARLVPAELAALERAAPIDLIVADERSRGWIETASAERQLSGGYRLVARPRPNMALLASAARASACPRAPP